MPIVACYRVFVVLGRCSNGFLVVLFRKGLPEDSISHVFCAGFNGEYVQSSTGLLNYFSTKRKAC